MRRLSESESAIASTALQEAVDVRGSQELLAEAIGCTQGAISKMLKRGFMSHDYVLRTEAATGVAKERLRPDLYPGAAGEADNQPLAVRSDNYRAAGTAMDPLP